MKIKNKWNFMIDQGGTFTDIIAVCPSNKVITKKVLSFKNDKKYKAWQLINKLGLKDLRCGDAVISDQHNNFMINIGKAKASDFENLGEMIIEKVLNEFGIRLEWEIQILGQNG